MKLKNQVGLVAGILLFITTFIGCVIQPNPNSVADHTAAVGTSLVQTDGHLQSADHNASLIPSHADATGKIYVNATRYDIAQGVKSNDQAKTDLQKVTKERDQLKQQVIDANGNYTTLSKKWYVVWGQRIQAAIVAIVVAWAGLGVASIVLGMGNPLSWAFTFSNEIAHFLPLANVFAWIRNWINSIRQKNAINNAAKSAASQVVADAKSLLKKA